MDQTWELKVSELEKLKRLALYMELHERKHYRVERHPDHTPQLIRDALQSNNQQIREQLDAVFKVMSPRLRQRLAAMQLAGGARRAQPQAARG